MDLSTLQLPPYIPVLMEVLTTEGIYLRFFEFISAVTSWIDGKG